jgi:hypothetical protein
MHLKDFKVLQWTCRANKLLHFLHLRFLHVCAEYGATTGKFHGYRIRRGTP